MIGILIKVLVLTVLVVWGGRKALVWISRMGGRYGKLASDILNLLNELGRELTRCLRWALYAVTVFLILRIAFLWWYQSKSEPSNPGDGAGKHQLANPGWKKDEV
jgi:hypothetical protein